MNDFASSTLRKCVLHIARRLKSPAFAEKRPGLSLLLEELRPHAKLRFETLTQSLYDRPTPDCENQISLLMRQPLSVVRVLLASNRLHNRRFERRRNNVGRASLVRRYCKNFQIPQRKEYLDLIRTDERSRIVVSFHCGDFLFGPASLFSLDRSTRKQFVLSLNESAVACYENLTAGFGPGAPDPACELLLSHTSSSQLSQLLRAGNTSLLLFGDVPPGLNETTEVRFLNRCAWFSIGPALLALANRVPLLPLINYSDGKFNHVRLGTQIEPTLAESETLRQGARRVTQDLVSFFESILLAYPEQWRFVSLLPFYFSKPDES